MMNDPIVNAVREQRDKLAKAFNYDVHAIFADLRKREVEHGSRLVKQIHEEPLASDAPASTIPLKLPNRRS